MLAKSLDAASSLRGSIGVEQLFNLSKIVAFLFVELFDLYLPSRPIDYTVLALVVTFLDLAVDGLPIVGCAVLAEAPFLELTLVLALAADGLGADTKIHASKFWTLTF